jgi:uncharacterized membrane protein HdeD (DUF308 family)
MILRYLKVFRRQILLVVLIIALIVISSVTKGKTATTTATLAGVAMIYGAVTFIIYIIKTPTKKDKDDGA